jgi:hypothetical protein
MSHYFQTTSLSGVIHFLDYIKDQLVTEGWTAYHLGTGSTQPTEDHFEGSYVFISNGKTGSVGDLPAHHGIWMGWAQNVGDSHIQYGVFSGHKRVPTGSLEKTSNTVTVNAVNHGLRVGDVLLVYGTDNTDFHAGWTNDDDPLVVASVPDADTFTYTDTITPSNISPATFQNIFAVYNAGGSFSAREDANYMIGDLDQMSGQFNPEFDVFGYCDEYRIGGVITVGGVYRPFYMGMMGRGHIPDSWKDCGRLVSNVTGTGNSITLQLDRSCPKMKAGQPIWLIPTNDSDGQKNDDHNTVSKGAPGGAFLTASAKPSDSRVTVELRSGDEYPPGTIVGYDPVPLIVIGENAASQVELRNMDCMLVFSNKGIVDKASSTSGSYEQTSHTCYPLLPYGFGANLDGELNPGVGQIYHGVDIAIVHRTAGNNYKGKRFPLPGFVAWGQGDQSDGDLMVVGENIPANRWKVFTSQRVSTLGSSNTILGIGPGAS